jgi:RHS repeat-associated protein
LTYDGVYTYNYDDQGNLTSKVGVNPSDVTTFTWDYRNRLTEEKRTVSGTVYDDVFTYDLWDRRIGKTSTTNGTNTVTLGTAYDGANPYGDWNGTNWKRYLYGSAVDQLFARYDDAGSGTLQWYLTDNLGSVVQIVSASGSSLDTMAYDSFGQPTDSTATYSTGDRFKFTGREWDSENGTGTPEIGQYNYRAREYDPRVGRFDSEDPIGFSAGDLNLYRYVQNSPTNFTDPSGLDKFWLIYKPWTIPGDLLDIITDNGAYKKPLPKNFDPLKDQPGVCSGSRFERGTLVDHDKTVQEFKKTLIETGVKAGTFVIPSELYQLYAVRKDICRRLRGLKAGSDWWQHEIRYLREIDDAIAKFPRPK